MNERINLSIIIPVYNGERYIKSIVSQILRLNNGSDISFELLLIDDGSADGSADVCLRLAEDHDNVHYYHKENGGIASARNYGLDIAKGEYITFADQDDSVISGYRSFIQICRDESLDLLITSPYNRKTGSDQINKRTFRDEVISDAVQIKKMAGKLIDGEYLSDSTVQFVSTSVWNVLYRREMLVNNNIRFKVFIDYEDDWIFNIETLLVSKRAAVSSEGYYCWNIRQGSESHRDKYISDLTKKRGQWMTWMKSILESIDISEDKKTAFIKNVLIPRNVIICFNNACWKPGSSKEEALTEIRNSNSFWKLKSIDLSSVDEMDKPNRLLLWLLCHNRINTAYLLNRKILGKRFH